MEVLPAYHFGDKILFEKELKDVFNEIWLSRLLFDYYEIIISIRHDIHHDGDLYFDMRSARFLLEERPFDRKKCFFNSQLCENNGLWRYRDFYQQTIYVSNLI